MHFIELPNRKIGPNQACFIIAEIGLNHNGDMALARQTIDAAIKAGADAVKFQNFITEDFIFDKNLTYTYQSQGKEVTELQFDMFKRYELSREQLFELAKYCHSKNIFFLSTPTNTQGIQDCVDAGALLMKNGSDYLGNLPLIEDMARAGLPTIISTGMATLSDIDDAVRAYKEAGGKNLILLHCTSSYPTPAEDVHLEKMKTLEHAFGTYVGFSDHSEGTIAAILSVSMGACVVEKHFTFDRNLPGPDHRFSSDPKEFLELVMGIRYAEKCFGDRAIGYTQGEKVSRKDYKLSCTAGIELKVGHKLTKEDIGFRRPGTGIPPKSVHLLVGRKLKHSVEQGKILNLEDLI